MKVAFIARSTLYRLQGGDGIQLSETARQLRQLGVHVDIFLSHEPINYEEYDILHFFCIIRPANILYHIKKTNKPFIVSPILVDYTEYDRQYRRGLSGFILNHVASGEYIKTIARWLLLRDSLVSKDYLWKGQQRSIKEVLQKAAMLLPNSTEELEALQHYYPTDVPHVIVANGVNKEIFAYNNTEPKDERLVICAARIEGIKNQINLIKALNNSKFTLLLIGQSSTNQTAYYKECKKIAAQNIVFAGKISQNELAGYYRKAKVHVLPSWFETCGLSSLEAAAMGCNIVITKKGYAKEYFRDHAFYCDPKSPESIYTAIEMASKTNLSETFRENFSNLYTWEQAARKTLLAYEMVLNKKISYPGPFCLVTKVSA